MTLGNHVAVMYLWRFAPVDSRLTPSGTALAMDTLGVDAGVWLAAIGNWEAGC